MEATLKVKAGMRFELRGGDVAVTCAMRDNGRPETLSYRSNGESRDFAGDELEIASTSIGTQVTVMLENGAADGPIVRFTVVLPLVRPNGDEKFDVTAAAVRTTERSLFGGPRPGPQQSYEAMGLEGTVVCGPAGPPKTRCHDWSAVLDAEPRGRATLVVTGTCTFPRAGYTVELRRVEPQGFNPADLLLERIVTEPPGPSAEVVTDVPVRYEEEAALRYQTVTILPEGPSIPVRHAR
jgi:hypothetical protein